MNEKKKRIVCINGKELRITRTLMQWKTKVFTKIWHEKYVYIYR
jgi:hypothetical protein